MALYRPPLECNSCGHKNSFEHNPLSEWQKINMWCGDNGGHYPDKCEKCGKSIFEFNLNLPDEIMAGEISFCENCFKITFHLEGICQRCNSKNV